MKVFKVLLGITWVVSVYLATGFWLGILLVGSTWGFDLRSLWESNTAQTLSGIAVTLFAIGLAALVYLRVDKKWP